MIVTNCCFHAISQSLKFFSFALYFRFFPLKQTVLTRTVHKSSFHKVHILVKSIPSSSMHYCEHLSLQISLEKLENLARPLLPQPLTSFRENQLVLLVEHRLSILPTVSSIL